jgi:hypothetical protein
MKKRFPRILRRKTAGLLALAVLAAVFFRTAHYGRLPPESPPSMLGHRIDVQGAQLAALAYADPGKAKKRFGFDIRGAGLLPIRLAIDNRSGGVARIDPRQTFLIDRQGLAWPLLTADQAHDRMAGAPDDRAKNAATPMPGVPEDGAAETFTGFAMSLLLQDGFEAAVPSRAAVETAVASERRPPVLEDRIRRDISLKSPRNPRLQSGELAQGYLFFPGREEAQGADTLRLVLELDGSPHVVRIPLAPAPAPGTPDQPRPMAR